MCFHYALTAKAKTANARYSQVNDDFNFVHANGFSNPKMPILLASTDERVNLFNWGLIPSWVKNVESAHDIRNKTLNARIETIFDKSSFKESVQEKRCLVLASGYYEYHIYNGKSYPYFISLKSNELFSFAGIWSQWYNKDIDRQINTFAIVTTIANPLLAKVHNKPKASKDARMPVILAKEDEKCWLSSDFKSNFSLFEKPYSELLMQAKMIHKIGDTQIQASLF